MKFLNVYKAIKQEWKSPEKNRLRLIAVLLSLFIKSNKYMLWSVEHSQYSEDHEMYPFHVGWLSKAILENVRDFTYNNRKGNKWQIVYIGTHAECCNAHDVMREKYEERQKIKTCIK